MSATLADDELLISRTFDAPASLVFALWTDPAHFRNWMGPGSYLCKHSEIDLRVGGAYRALIASADDPNNWFGGVYREIVPNERLVFTFKWDESHEDGPPVDTLVTVQLRDAPDGGTLMDFTHEGLKSEASLTGHRHGWTSTFERLEAFLAAGGG